MADLSITAANVVPATGALVSHGIAGGTITAGMPVYVAADGDIEPCDADAAASAVCVGIALNAASAGQPVSWITRGGLTIGATVVLGVGYYVTPNPGGLGAWAEVQAGDYATLVCVGLTTSTVWVEPIVTAGAKA